MVLTTTPPIEVILSKGLYVFDDMSGTGKSFMYHTLIPLQSSPEYGIALCNSLAGCIIIPTLNPKFVLADRFDLWGTDDLAGLLKDVAENAIVLVDAKSFLTVIPALAKTAYIHAQNGGVLVNDIPDRR